MNLELIHKDFPIWEVTGWTVPDIDYKNIAHKKFNQSSKHYKSSDLRQILDLDFNFYEQGVDIQNMLRESDLLVLDQMLK